MQRIREKNHNPYVVNLKVSGGNRSGSGKVKEFDKNKVDYLFVVAEENVKYLIKTKDISAKTCLTLNTSWDNCVVN